MRIEPLERGARLHFDEVEGHRPDPVQADVVVACDGVNSAVRRHFYPADQVCYGGINTWRGTTVHKPILDGRSYIRVGSIDTGKMVIYPIADNVDGQGNQLINWVAEIRDPQARMNDWNRPGRLEEFLPPSRTGSTTGWMCRRSSPGRRPSLNTPWSTRTRCRAGASTGSRSWAMPRTPCIRAARTDRRRP